MTRSRTSHAWLLVEDPVFDLRLVLEAHSTGFRLVSFTRFVKENRVVALVQTRHRLDDAMPRAAEWLGEKFDVLGLFGIFLTLVMRWFHQRPWRNPFPTPSALFCSEAVVRTLKGAGYPEAHRLGNETTSPADLLRFLRLNPANVVHEGEGMKLWSHLKARLKAEKAQLRTQKARPRPELDHEETEPAFPPEAPPTF
jgi:hypothetical protein